MSLRPLSSYVGLLNQGSTCYLSSAIQALFHLPLFRTKLYKLKLGANDKVACALRNIFAELDAGNKNICTEELTEAFGWDSAAAAVQHDVHELMQQLFDKLEATVKGSEHESFIRDIFHGLTIYRSKAIDADYVADRLEGFYDTELVVKGKATITESLHAFVEPDRIEGVSLELTPGAKPSTHTIERTQKFLELPPVLLVHPNRVTFDTETFELVTLANRWTFGTELDLRDFMLDGGSLRLDKESKEKLTRLHRNNHMAHCGARYELRTILIHAGDANIGHYYTFVRFGDEWLRFNDELVDKVTVEEVEKAAFGGQVVAQSRYRLFDNERASLLVFVNTDMAAEVLRETPAPQEILNQAQRLEAERNKAQTTKTVKYYISSSKMVDILDCTPGAMEDNIKELEVEISWGTTAVHEAIAKEVGVAPDCLRMTNFHTLPATEFGRLSAHQTFFYRNILLFHVLRSPTAEPFFVLVRTLSGKDGKLGAAAMLESREAVMNVVPKGSVIYACGANPPRALLVTSYNDIPDGANLIVCPSEVRAADVEHAIEKRQYMRTTVVHVDAMRGSFEPVFTLTVSGDVLYTTLQGGVYDTLKSRKAPYLPKSSQHLGFFRYNEQTGRPELLPRPAATSWYTGGPVYDTTLDALWGRGKERKLFFTVLPKPLGSLNLHTTVVVGLGWSKQPFVYLDAGITVLTMEKLLDIAVQQLGASLPPRLAQYRQLKLEASNVVRLLYVSKNSIASVVTRPHDEVNVATSAFTLVLDPVLRLEGHDVVDVLFCDRRAGEQYFGTPTNINVSAAMSEIGKDIIARVAKKLGLPAELEAEAQKKWILSVKSGTKGINKVKTASAKDTLRTLVESTGGKPYIFVVDRPKMLELDGEEDSRRANAIVIKAASMVDLSAL